jgi:hypothetical protein
MKTMITTSTHAPVVAPTIAPTCDVFTWPVAVEVEVLVDPSEGALFVVGDWDAVPAPELPELAAAGALVKGGRGFANDAEKPDGVENEIVEVGATPDVGVSLDFDCVLGATTITVVLGKAMLVELAGEEEEPDSP